MSLVKPLVAQRSHWAAKHLPLEDSCARPATPLTSMDNAHGIPFQRLTDQIIYRQATTLQTLPSHCIAVAISCVVDLWGCVLVFVLNKQTMVDNEDVRGHATTDTETEIVCVFDCCCHMVEDSEGCRSALTGDGGVCRMFVQNVETHFCFIWDNSPIESNVWEPVDNNNPVSRVLVNWLAIK